MITATMLPCTAEIFSHPKTYNSWRNIDWNDSRQLNNTIMGESTTLMGAQGELPHSLVSAAQLGLATGLLTILITSHLLSTKELKTKPLVSEHQTLLLRVFCLVLSAAAVPLVVVVLLLLAAYRRFVRVALSLTDRRFADLLEGTDAVWALEDDTSKSIINVLVFFEVEIVDNVFKEPQLLATLRRLMRERILTSPEYCPKFWQHRRRSSLGYFYWERQHEVRVEDHVKYMTEEDDKINLDAPDLTDAFQQEHYGMSESVLRDLVSELANSPLPFDNAASWEILIGRDPILEAILEVDPFKAMEEGNLEAIKRYRRYPVLFRVHHSMGDGVALIRLLLETLADKKAVTDSPRGVTTTKILGYDNEEKKRVPRRRTISQREGADLIKSSHESFHDVNKFDDNNINRPTFLNLENSQKKLMSDFMVSDMIYSDLKERDEISLDSPTIFSTKFDLPEDFDDAEQVSSDDKGSSVEDFEVANVGYNRRDLYCYPVDKKLEPFMEEPLSPDRCESPMPPFKRDASRIVRALDKVIELRKSHSQRFTRKNSWSSGSESTVTMNFDDCSRRGSMFSTDGSPLRNTHQRMNLPLIGHDTRNVSPVPKIHRKKYPVSYDDYDSDDSLPSSPRATSPFLRGHSPLHHLSKANPQHTRKNVLKFQNDGFVSNPNFQFNRRHSSTSFNSVSYTRCHSPVLRDGFPRDNTTLPYPRKGDLPPRTTTPQPRNDGLGLRSSQNLPRRHSSTSSNNIRCRSPLLIRDNTPVHHKVDLLSMCNTQTERNVSHFRDETFYPRCKSPLTKINPSPLDIATPSIGRSPSPVNESPNNKNELVNRKSPMNLTNSCNNLEVNDVLGNSFTNSVEKDKKRPPALTLSPDDEVINRSSPRRFVKLLDSIESRPSVFEHLCTYIKDMWAFIFAPASVIYQSMIKMTDVNPLHGPELSGHKVVSWFFDSHHDTSENLLGKIKRIKTRIPGVKFSDVVLSAISSSLESYFLRSGCEGKSMPESVSVVVAGRMMTRNEMEEDAAISNKNPSQEDSIKIPALENKFSVALLLLPLTPVSTDTKITKSFSPIGRLRKVSKQTDLMRASRDYLINYWLMRVVPAYLPLPLLAPVLDSARSTVVFSNLVGPTSPLELGGFLLKDIVFWVPNRGATGVGVSVLSYASRIQIGITADSALLTSQQDANIIIEGIISELKCLDKITAPIKTHPLKV